MESCLQVTTVGTVARPQSLHPFSAREKVVFPTYRGFKKCFSKSATSSNPSLYSAAGTNRKFSVICNAREAVNEGNSPICLLLIALILIFLLKLYNISVSLKNESKGQNYIVYM